MSALYQCISIGSESNGAASYCHLSQKVGEIPQNWQTMHLRLMLREIQAIYDGEATPKTTCKK